MQSVELMMCTMYNISTITDLKLHLHLIQKFRDLPQPMRHFQIRIYICRKRCSMVSKDYVESFP